MGDHTKRASVYSRRDFGKLALATLPGASVLARSHAAFGLQSKPNSVWGGVPFGIFAPYRFGPEASDLEGVLRALIKFGVSNTELSAAVVERYIGAPQANTGGRATAAPPAPAVSSAAPAAPAGGPAAGA